MAAPAQKDMEYALLPCTKFPGLSADYGMATDPLLQPLNVVSSLHPRSIEATSGSINSSEEATQCQRHSRMVKRSNGRSLVRHHLPPQSYLGYIKDFFTSILDARWYVIILFFFTCYFLSWLLFGGVWTILAYTYTNPNITCVYNVNDFKSAFLFSVETQTTIGFGVRYPSSACGVAVTLLGLQSVVGLLIDSFLLGLVFAKLTRPRNRRQTVFFSNKAVIRNETGKKQSRESGGQSGKKTEQRRVLEFRIADVRRSQVVEGHVRLQLYWYREVSDGGYDLQQYDLDVGYDTGRDRLFLLTPVSVYHYITEDSPLHGMTQEILSSSHLELVVILEGIVEATGLTAQILWSYTRDEIEFDMWFQPMSYYCVNRCEWVVDFTKLSSLQSSPYKLLS